MECNKTTQSTKQNKCKQLGSNESLRGKLPPHSCTTINTHILVVSISVSVTQWLQFKLKVPWLWSVLMSRYVHRERERGKQEDKSIHCYIVYNITLFSKYFIGWTVEYNGLDTPVMYKLYNNSLHKTSMMYRIVYTKLNYSLLSQLLDILQIWGV